LPCAVIFHTLWSIVMCFRDNYLPLAESPLPLVSLAVFEYRPSEVRRKGDSARKSCHCSYIWVTTKSDGCHFILLPKFFKYRSVSIVWSRRDIVSSSGVAVPEKEQKLFYFSYKNTSVQTNEYILLAYVMENYEPWYVMCGNGCCSPLSASASRNRGQLFRPFGPRLHGVWSTDR
jgi:hypothetical protein